MTTDLQIRNLFLNFVGKNGLLFVILLMFFHPCLPLWGKPVSLFAAPRFFRKGHFDKRRIE